MDEMIFAIKRTVLSAYRFVITLHEDVTNPAFCFQGCGRILRIKGEVLSYSGARLDCCGDCYTDLVVGR